MERFRTIVDHVARSTLFGLFLVFLAVGGYYACSDDVLPPLDGSTPAEAGAGDGTTGVDAVATPDAPIVDALTVDAPAVDSSRDGPSDDGVSADMLTEDGRPADGRPDGRGDSSTADAIMDAITTGG